MSTPTQNSVQVTTLSLAALGNDQGALISGYKWGGGWGVGVNLTFSFIPGPPNDFFIDNYGGGIGNGEFGQAYGLSATEQAAVTSALAAWSGIANINFTKVSDNQNVVGDLRFGVTGVDTANEEAHAYLPTAQPWGGDVWFSLSHWHTAPTTPVAKGSYDYLTIIHEVGHALGLKHPFEGARQLPPAFDSYSYSVMSYDAPAAAAGRTPSSGMPAATSSPEAPATTS